MFGLGIPELMVICVIALVVVGPKRLPDIGKAAGRAIVEFKKASQSVQQAIAEELRETKGSVHDGAMDAAGREIVLREQVRVPKGVPGEDPEKPAHANN